ncbi:MAG: hypothetical protein PSX81_04205 [bacterium]|nr:hypothetical protein [bacterium]
MKFTCLILIFVVFKMDAQNRYDFNHAFDWEEVEKWNPKLIEKFIQLTPKEFEYYRTKEAYYPNLDSLKKVLHVVDLNGDNLDDIVFAGQTFGEPKEVSLFVNTGKSFKKVFRDLQGLLKMEFTGGILSQLNIEDWGCCADYRTFVKFYKVRLEKGELKFELQNNFQYLQNTQLPTMYSDTVKQIRILNDLYNLRTTPLVDDSTITGYEGQEVKGNVLGKIPKGAMALVLAQEVDSTGRVWYFVAILPAYVLKQTVFFDADTAPQYHKCGWISSRFVEEISK